MVKLFPNDLQFLKSLIAKVYSRADVFAIKIVFKNMVNYLVALLNIQLLEV